MGTKPERKMFMNGKERCRILKELRRTVADRNGIPYESPICTHQGECLGTCPRCEAELAYLDRAIAKRQALGKTVVLAGIAAVTAISGGCMLTEHGLLPGGEVDGDMQPPPGGVSAVISDETESGRETHKALTGEVCESETYEELMGDVAYLPPPELRELEKTCQTDDDYRRALSLCVRRDIRESWGEWLVGSREGSDTFRLPETPSCVLVLTYDEWGYVSSVAIGDVQP